MYLHYVIIKWTEVNWVFELFYFYFCKELPGLVGLIARVYVKEVGEKKERFVYTCGSVFIRERRTIRHFVGINLAEI